MQEAKVPKSLLAELDRCVKCGMCLPECPTYRLTVNENESPRGRLALIEGLVQGRIGIDESLSTHLDHCLGCRRCERVCPSQVRYGYLIDQARNMIADETGQPLSAVIRRPRLLRLGTRLAHAVPTVLSKPISGLHRMHHLARSLPASSAAPTAGEYAANGATVRGRVGLFCGCAIQQGDVLQAALTLLRHAGFTVVVPADAGCCGALAQHGGDSTSATRLADVNRAAFDDRLDGVISIASGCGIHLDDYQPPLSARHWDVCQFLLEQADLDTTDFQALPETVLLHTPCSVENVYRGGAWARGLLGLIAGLNVEDIGEPGQCCGSAGDYMLRHPETADRLRQPLLEQIKTQPGRPVLTGNVGCAMHIAAGINGEVPAHEVLHPIELLARQLRR